MQLAFQQPQKVWICQEVIKTLTWNFLSYLIFSNRLSQSSREKLSRFAGVSTAHLDKDAHALKDSAQITPARSIRKEPSDFESSVSEKYDDITPPIPQTGPSENGKLENGHSSVNRLGKRDEAGMAVNQEDALANLDPRTLTTDPEGRTQRLGNTAEAVADSDRKEGEDVPQGAIGFSTKYELSK